MGELELKSKVFELVEYLERAGHHVHVPRHDRDYAVSTGLRMLTLRHLVKDDGEGHYHFDKKEIIVLQYYANSIAHLLEMPVQSDE